MINTTPISQMPIEDAIDIARVRRALRQDPNKSWRRHARRLGMSNRRFCLIAICLRQDETDFSSKRYNVPIGKKNKLLDIPESDIVEMRRKYHYDGVPAQKIADEYNLSYLTAYDLVVGTRRTDAGGPVSVNVRATRRPGQTLSNETVVLMRERYWEVDNPNRSTAKQLSLDFCVPYRTVMLLLIGRTYSDVDGPTKANPALGLRANRAIRKPLSNAQVRAIREEFARDMDITPIIWLGDKYGHSSQVMRDLLYGRSYSDAGGPIIDPDELAEARRYIRRVPYADQRDVLQLWDSQEYSVTEIADITRNSVERVRATLKLYEEGRISPDD